jgi:hypothetical protein
MGKDMNVDSFSPSLVEDLCNMMSGGTFVTESDIKHQVTNNFSQMFLAKTKEHQEESILKEMEYHRNIQTFLRDMPSIDDIPGDSPMEQSFNFLKILGNSADPGTSDSPTDGEGIPQFAKKGQTEGTRLLNKFSQSQQLMKKLRPEDKEALNLDEDEVLAMSQLMSSDVKRNIALACSKIEQLNAISTKVSTKFRIDSSGTFVFSRGIRGFDEMSQLTHNEFLLPTAALSQRIIDGESRVSQRYSKETQMPFITMICDDSGSMKASYKCAKALGIIMNVVQRVEKKECILLFSFFEKHCHKFVLLSSEEESREWFQNVAMKKNFNTCTTDVATSCKEALDEFNKVQLQFSSKISKDRHLIIINDGEDDASSLTRSMFPNTKVHAFVLDSSNDDLKRICNQTGGVYKQHI